MTDQPVIASPLDIPCACCGHTMDSAWQQPMYAGMTGYWLITCENKACEMYGFTFSERDYPVEGMFETYGVQL